MFPTAFKMKMRILFLVTLVLMLGSSSAQQSHVIYVIDTIPQADAGVQSALNAYKLSFENGNETDLMSNYDTYKLMDSLYGKGWPKKLGSSMDDHKGWKAFITKPKPHTNYTDNWNWTRYSYYSVGLLKSIETRSCGYNLRCGLQTKEYSREGKVTSNKMKTVSKDK